MGHDFARIDPQHLVFGQTTESEIVALNGEPTQWTAQDAKWNTIPAPTPFSSAPVAGLEDNLRYEYLKRSLDDADGGKVGLFFFKNHRLCATTFSSDIADASTAFDMGQARVIRKGMSREAVRAALGEPSGMSVFPCVRDRDDTIWRYSYQHLTNRRNVSRHLMVLFDDGGHVQDISLDSNDAPLP